jgi:DNA ligase-1
VNMIEPKILYSRTATGAVNVWSCWAEGADVVTRWGQQDGLQQTAKFTCSGKNVGKKNATTGEQQAVKEVEALVKKKLKEKYSESLETAGETARIKPLLAGDWEKHKSKIKWGAHVQPKLDGVRTLSYRIDGKVVLQSRRGDFYDVKHIQDQLESVLGPDDVLDGELYIHGTPLQTITSLVRRSQAGSKALEYHLYDVVVEDVQWSERYELLYGLDLKGASHVGRVATLTANSEEEVVEHQKNFIEAGYEGAIVRNGKGLYREGYRSPDLLKVKSWQDDEFRVVGWKTGKGKFESVPVFSCVTKEGKTFDVAPKGTAEERAEMLKNADSLVGQLMKVKYFQLTQDLIPQFPVGLGLRMPEDM